MKLDDLTLGDLKQLRAMFGGGEAKAPVAPTGRAIVVVDRGWIFAGDLSLTADGYLRLDRAVWLFRWEAVGFASVIKDPGKADIRPIDPVEVPQGSIVFRIPVGGEWGIKS